MKLKDGEEREGGEREGGERERDKKGDERDEVVEKMKKEKKGGGRSLPSIVRIAVTESSVSGVSALAVLRIDSLPDFLSMTSHAHPEPNCVAPAAENSLTKFSEEPKSRAMAAARAAPGLVFFGLMLSQ